MQLCGRPPCCASDEPYCACSSSSLGVKQRLLLDARVLQSSMKLRDKAEVAEMLDAMCLGTNRSPALLPSNRHTGTMNSHLT